MSDMFFLRGVDECWICRQRGPLTGEHKMKASDLKASFGNEKMAKFVWGDDSGRRPTHLNSPNSKNAKFKKSICNSCNSSLTKPYDEAYSTFSDDLRDLISQSREPNVVCDMWPWNDGTASENVDCRKYFEKLIGCHAAEVDAPIPLYLSKSVYERNFSPCASVTVFCNADLMNALIKARSKGEALPHIAHHGLSVMFDRQSGLPRAYRSGLRIDWAEVQFEYEFDSDEVECLTTLHAVFLDRARTNIQ